MSDIPVGIRAAISGRNVNQNNMVAPKVHVGVGEGDKAIPLIHADAFQLSVDVQNDADTGEYQNAFVALQLLYGDSGLYVGLSAASCERIAKDLQATAARLRKTEELRAPACDDEDFKDVDMPEGFEELLGN